MDYFWPCIFSLWVIYLWETYLSVRQRRVYGRVKEVPSELKAVLDQQTLIKSASYQLDKSTFSLLHELFGQIVLTVVLFLNALPFAWNLSGSFIGYFGLGTEYEITQSLAFIMILTLFSKVLDLPWSVYSTFYLEQKHGFNKQTPAFFIKDQIKMLILNTALTFVILPGLLHLFHWGGTYFYIYAWLFTLAFSLVLMFIYPDFIAPLFDKYTPIPEGTLKFAIEALAASLNYPLKKVLIVEGSKRSAHSNAYLYGFWKNKRIVLFDTLIQDDLIEKGAQGSPNEGAQGSPNEGAQGSPNEGAQCSPNEGAQGSPNEGDVQVLEAQENKVEQKPEQKKSKGCDLDEILAVLTHELGHWKYGHTLKLITVMQGHLLLSFFLFGYFMYQPDVYTSFGFSSHPTLVGLIIVMQFIFSPYNLVFGFISVQMTRQFEYQADSFALTQKKAAFLRSALIKLASENLMFPVADSLYSAFNHTHPTILERLRALKQKDE